MLLLSTFVRPKMGYVQGKIGLTGRFDRRQPGKLFAALLSLHGAGLTLINLLDTKLKCFTSPQMQDESFFI